MEKFYIVTDQSKLRTDYLSYLENNKKEKEIMKSFMLKHGIKTTGYYATTEQLYIIPIAEDILEFDKFLCKEWVQGLRAFKKVSAINKDWVKTLKEKDFEIIDKPYTPMYFNNGGNSSTRLFEVDGTVYCSMESNNDFDNPIGMIEMRGSEFFKIIEDDEAKVGE